MTIGAVQGSAPPSQNPGTAFQTGPGATAQQSAGVTAVPPSAGSSETTNSGADNGGTAEKRSERQAEAAMRSRTGTPINPQKAEPRSVVNAIARAEQGSVSETDRPADRARAMIDSVAQVKQQPEQYEPRSKVDRYAPPDPIPTSETLKAIKNAQKAEQERAQAS